MSWKLATAILVGPMLFWGCATRDSRALLASEGCVGQVAIVRVVTLTPSGTRAGLESAMRQHEAWYRAHGFTRNRIISAPVLELRGDRYVPAENRFLTLHLSPPIRNGQEPDDAEWRHFVAQYDSNVQPTEPVVVCLPSRLD
jgi:hypothetical protein